MQHVILLFPVYNDEASFNIIACQIEKLTREIPDHQFSFLAINDGSLKKPELKASLPLTTIHLHSNIGHQKAIAIGLSYAHHHLRFDKIIVMDADGEDRPEDLLLLLDPAVQNEQVKFAHRSSRQNGKKFRSFYAIYKVLFRLLTGKRISFGNFMLLPATQVSRLVYTSEIWNHLAGAILKTRVPFVTVPTHRGKRFEGSSKMSFTALLMHGLGAIGVFIDIIATRLLIFSLLMIMVSILGILIITGIKFFTDAAIPGWATMAFSSMLIVLLQSFLLSLFTIFLYLSSQSQRKFIPANHYEDYTASVETI